MLKISLRMFKLSLFKMFMLTKLFTFKLSLLKINYSGGLGLKAWREQSASHGDFYMFMSRLHAQDIIAYVQAIIV